jgi:hypothetical protein
VANQVYETGTLILSVYLRNLMLAALAARPAAALWATPTVHLSQDPAFNPTQDSVLATLAANEATFTGYAAATPVLAGPYNSTVNTQVEISTVVFAATPSGSFIPNQIYGYWLSDGTNYIAGEAFGSAGPVAIQAAGDYVEIDLLVPLFYRQTSQA